jgi:hypothetical protein
MKKAAKKVIKIDFKVAQEDGIISTVVKDKIETEATPYKKGDFLVTGPLGETYPMSPEDFNKRYAITSEGKAESLPIEVQGYFTKAAIEIIAEWGEQQKLPAGSFLIVNNGKVAYGIDPEAFDLTYDIYM